MTKWKRTLKKNAVPLLFISLSAFAFLYSGASGPVVVSDVVSRFARNAILVLSLIFPVLAGMGLNFGIAIGAMAGQIALFFVMLAGITGTNGLLAAALLCVPLAVVFGWLSSLVLNRTKGQEMITSMLLAFFASGVYQFFFLYLLGGVIPVNNPDFLMGSGIGVRSNLDMTGMQYALDDLLKTDVFTCLLATAAGFGVWLVYQAVKHKKQPLYLALLFALDAALLALGVLGKFGGLWPQYRVMVQIPVATLLVVALVGFVIRYFFSTRMGQRMRAVGNDTTASSAVGIDVNRVRTQAMILSTLVAALGQIVYLQNIGTIAVYSAHENVGMFSAAALLVGGASVSGATVPQALLGTLLFHLLFNILPIAGQKLFGSPEIGEYFRVFIAYGIIAVTLSLYAWKITAKRNATREKKRN
ncbi:MAG: ABC transporter permease [Eubacteriales bacterium]|nr:ABC transporter permease [Eubacteriales bacterium]